MYPTRVWNEREGYAGFFLLQSIALQDNQPSLIDPWV